MAVPTALKIIPDFKAATRTNLEYQNVYGSNKNPHDPGWEIGGDASALARQSYSTPEIRKTFNEVVNFGMQGAINGATGRQGHAPNSSMVRLQGINFWKYRKPLNVSRQMTLTQARVDGDDDTASASSPWTTLIIILLFVFGISFLLNNV